MVLGKGRNPSDLAPPMGEKEEQTRPFNNGLGEIKLAGSKID